MTFCWEHFSRFIKLLGNNLRLLTLFFPHNTHDSLLFRAQGFYKFHTAMKSHDFDYYIYPEM